MGARGSNAHGGRGYYLAAATVVDFLTLRDHGHDAFS